MWSALNVGYVLYTSQYSSDIARVYSTQLNWHVGKKRIVNALHIPSSVSAAQSRVATYAVRKSPVRGCDQRAFVTRMARWKSKASLLVTECVAHGELGQIMHTWFTIMAWNGWIQLLRSECIESECIESFAYLNVTCCWCYSYFTMLRRCKLRDFQLVGIVSKLTWKLKAWWGSTGWTEQLRQSRDKMKVCVKWRIPGARSFFAPASYLLPTHK